MRNKEIITILLLVAFAFLLVGILQYFNLYEGLESGEIAVPPPVPPEPTTEQTKKTTITKFDF